MNNFLIIILSLIFSAFFSGMEIAFISSNKLRLELNKKQDSFTSKILTLFSDNPGQFIATMLIGNNIALVIYGIQMALLLEPSIAGITRSESSILLIQTIISTLIILFTAEFLPKTIFRIRPNSALQFFAVPVLFFYTIFYPISIFTIRLSNLMLGLFFKQNMDTRRTTKRVFTKVDLDSLVNEGKNDEQDEHELEHDIKIFQNALDFPNVKVRECMIPRTEIVAVDCTADISEIKQKLTETGLSKMLVYKENIDNVTGYIHAKDLFKNPTTLKSYLRHISIVPGTMPANKLLNEFVKENKSIAVVVDEFGGTAGLVTIEDLIEEIFGEILDEHDTIDWVDRQINENEYILSGRLEIDYLNEKYKMGLPESEEYETLAGFILFHHESMPEKREIISFLHFKFEILKVSDTRVELVRLKTQNG